MRFLVGCFLLLPRIVGPTASVSGVRDLEAVLIQAISQKDEAGVSRLLDRDFHVSWTEGSAVRNFGFNCGPRPWVTALTSREVRSYTAKLIKVRSAGLKAVYVRLQETLTVGSRSGSTVEKRVESVDTWVQQKAGCKLVSRLSHS